MIASASTPEPDDGTGFAGPGGPGGGGTDRAEHWRQRLAIPVVAAALISLPAVFLTTSSEPVLVYAGHALNWISLGVLGLETVVLFAFSSDRRAWARRYRWQLAIAVLAVPAVLFTLFPVQAMRLLQLVRLLGTLRVRRATRIVKAARVLATRFGLDGIRRHLLIGAGTTLAVVFAAVVLADPVVLRRHRTALDQLTDMWLPLSPIVALALVGSISSSVIVIILRSRRRRRNRTRGEREGQHGENG